MRKILQAFKKLFGRKAKEPEEDVVYLCDPVKNVKCTKEGCWWISRGPCKCTRNKACARRGPGGKRVVAASEDIFNLEWMEEQIG